jgi:hypothetical protein
MTVKEFIKKLNEFPSDLQVFTEYGGLIYPLREKEVIKMKHDGRDVLVIE